MFVEKERNDHQEVTVKERSISFNSFKEEEESFVIHGSSPKKHLFLSNVDSTHIVHNNCVDINDYSPLSGKSNGTSVVSDFVDTDSFTRLIHFLQSEHRSHTTDQLYKVTFKEIPTNNGGNRRYRCNLSVPQKDISNYSNNESQFQFIVFEGDGTSHKVSKRVAAENALKYYKKSSSAIVPAPPVYVSGDKQQTNTKQQSVQMDIASDSYINNDNSIIISGCLLYYYTYEYIIIIIIIIIM